jgi:tRNA threonylcarbamoyladenosine biosynthesis protein TsaB
MGSAGLDKRDLTAIVATVGPGSFTGLRIGLAVAKGIAVARDIPIVGVNQFEVAAYRLRHEPEPVLVIVPFKSDAVFAATVRGGTFDPSAIDVVPVAAITEAAQQGRVAVFGLEGKAPDAPRVTALETDIADLAFLGRRKLAAGEVADPAGLEPLYVQRSQAEIRFDERQRGE